MCFFYFFSFFLLFCFSPFSQEREKEDMDLGGWGGGEDLGGVGGRETTIKIYFIKKCFQLKIKRVLLFNLLAMIKCRNKRD